MIRALSPYILGAIVGAFALWVFAMPHNAPLGFGTTEVAPLLQSGLAELRSKGVDPTKSTRIVLEPTTDCPTIAGSPCLRVEATRPISPRSFSPDTVEVFISMEGKNEK